MTLQDHLIIPAWPAPSNVRALQTTRHGGVSAAPYDSLNLGEHVGDAPLNVARNRMLLSPLLPGEPVWLEQVHGTTVISADMASCARPRHGVAEHSGAGVAALHLLPQTAGFAITSDLASVVGSPSRMASSSISNVSEVQADGCIARQRGSVCVVMTADCLPVLLCDKQGSVVGAAHAGWKGLASGVIEATVQAMGVAPQNLIAWLGPAISQQAFEVGEEVRATFVAAHPQAASAFAPGLPGKWFADIYALARIRLNELGIRLIYGGNFCTSRERDRFFSYRRDGVTGRMGTFIWIE